jgi:serine/threonine protein phosphatase PrpC
LKLIAHGKTDKGLVRKENEDVFCIEGDHGFLAVADGMGGYASGEVASKMAIDIVRDYLKNEEDPLLSEYNPKYSKPTNRMTSGIRLANKAIYDASRSQSQLNGMGTTIAAVLFSGNRLSIAHVGDSRVYLIRGGNIEQITDDHTVVSEQVERGLMTREEAAESDMRHILTRALGTAPDVEVDMDELTVSEGDKFVLCSDGLSELVLEDEIQFTVLSNNTPGIACDQLIKMANERGGGDNVTVIVASLFKEGLLHRFLRILGFLRG